MILLVAEHEGSTLQKSAAELAAVATSLKSRLGGRVTGLVVGVDAGTAAAELSHFVDSVLLVEEPDLADVRSEALTTVVCEAAVRSESRIVLMAGSRTGLSVSPRVAVRLGGALLEEVTSLEVDGESLSATRLSYLSRVTERVRADREVIVVSVKANMFPLGERGGGAPIERFSVTLGPADLRVEVGGRTEAQRGRVSLEEADVVVTGGRGVGGPEGFSDLVEPLADLLGAGVGATRAVVDAGWRPYAEQVGQTGKSVAPTLYIALGVSGAVQHLSGMNRSKVVVAVNRDGDAPIFKVADYGIVGDVNRVVPALLEAFVSLQG